MAILSYINGEWIESNVKGYFGVIDPAPGQVIAQTPLCNSEDVYAAARAASHACQQCG